MIPFHTWLSQIVGYCHFVADDLGVTRAWVDGDYSRTSITSFDELYEQIFDDLDSDALEQELSAHLPDDPETQEFVGAFLRQLRMISAQRMHDRELGSAASLINSKEWHGLVKIARHVMFRSPLDSHSPRQVTPS